MSANYRNPNWLLPNELNQSINPSLSESRKSLYSMNFDGTSDHIDLETVNFGVNSTLSFWCFYTSNNSVVFGDGGGFNYYIYFYGTSVYFRSGSTLWSSVLTKDVWQHYCFVRNGDSVELFINNVSQGVRTGAGTTHQSSIASIGAKPNGTFRFGGKIDEVAMWNKALSDTEVAALSTAGAPANLMALSAKPFAYYPLGEFAGNSGELGGTPSGQTNSWKFPNQAIKDYVFDFDGSSYIETPSINLGTENTISFWAKRDGVNFNGAVLGGSSASNYYTVYLNGVNNILYRLAGSANTFNNADIVSTLGANEWFHCALVRNNSGADVLCYINGYLKQTLTGVVGNTNNTIVENIGARSLNDLKITGNLSNIQIFNTDLPATGSNSVQTLYNNGSPLTSMSGFTSLQSWWKLNAATSSYNPATSTWTITDSAGSNNGTSTTLSSSSLIPSDLQFESPYSNFSLDFDGTNWLDLTSSLTSLNVSTAFSVSCWFKISTNTNYDHIIAAPTGWNTWSSGFGLYCNGSGVRFWVDQWNNPSNQHVSSGSLNNDQWYHAVCTFNTTSGLKLYINAGTAITSAGTNFTGLSNNIYIASAGSNSGYAFNGSIDEVAIWNSELTALQVNQVYNNGRPGDLTSLSPISWSRLGEDAFFVNNNITIPNQISGGPTGTGSGTQTAMLSADAPQSYGGGYGVGLAVTDKIGDAPESTANSLSYNMIPDNRHPYIPGYAPAQVDNNFSMNFDAASDNYMLVPGSAFSASASDFSISFWYFRSSNPSGHETVIYKASNFEIYQHSNGQAFWTYFGGVSSNTNKIPIVLNGWKHVCYVVTSTGFKGYQNGSLVAENTFSSTPNYGGVSNSMYFGGQQSVKHSNMKLDEIAFFDYALTAKQIKEDIYNASTTGKTADLSNNSNLTAPVAWYRMGD